MTGFINRWSPCIPLGKGGGMIFFSVSESISDVIETNSERQNHHYSLIVSNLAIPVML
jgi:hypothetical protein